MKKLLALGLIFLIALELAGCISISENAEFDENYELVIGICSGPYGFHPWMNSYDVDTMSINCNMFNSLVEFDNLFRITPALAESWNNPNNLTWRFNLRKNVKFHNGYDFIAEDIKYTIDLIRQDNNSALRELLTSVSHVNIIDNHTVDIITIRPCPILLNKLVDIYIVSKKYQEEIDYEWPIGTGPYKLKQYIEEKNITFERFDRYWAGKPSIKSVVFEILCESEDRKNALLNGDIDICGVHPDDYLEIYNATGLDVKTVSPPTVFYLSFDFRDYNSSYKYGEKNPVSDVNVRKAIYHAIDIEYLIENNLNGFGGAASQFVSPLIFGYNPNIKRLSYDLDTARDLLNGSGYENGFKIDFDCVESNSSREFYIEIAEMLGKINIEVNINFLPGPELFHKLFEKNSTMFFMGWLTATTDGGEVFDFILRSVDEKNSTGMYNYGYYSNPEVDSIGTQINSMMDTQKRLSLMQDGFMIAMNDVAWIPLYIPQSIYGCKENIDWIPYAGMGYNVVDIKCKC
jgi:peptide/nickel transport system substrate-binding protein